MPALTAADVTVAVEDRTVSGKKHRNRVKITFGNGSLTYPSGGVPMPTPNRFGMQRQLDYLDLLDADDSNGIVWKYDKENNKLRGYIQGVNISAAGAGTLDDYPLNTTAEPQASAISVGLVTGATGVTYLGRLQELATTHAPAAQTVYAEAVGW